jgi:hypothetical protein
LDFAAKGTAPACGSRRRPLRRHSIKWNRLAFRDAGLAVGTPTCEIASA